MSGGRSTVFSERELRVLERIGDIMLPRHGDRPSFSELGCIEHVDSVVVYAPEDDIGSLRAVLRVLSVCPLVVVRGVVWACHHADRFPGAVAPPLRLLKMAFRGILGTLYYSGKTGAQYTGPSPLEQIGFALNRVPRDGVKGSG